MKYNKPVTTIKEQIRILQSGGMIINDTSEAEFTLEHINYYRLGYYWRLFVENPNGITCINNIKHDKFYNGTEFSNIIKLYNFDERLSVTLFEAIKKIEVSLRIQLARHLAYNYGAHAHLNSSVFNKNSHPDNIKKIREKLIRKRSIHNLYSKYEEVLPPIWATVEIMDFSDLSKWYKSIDYNNKVKYNISTSYGVKKISTFESWLQHLSEVRNSDAHHDYLIYDKKFKAIKNDKIYFQGRSIITDKIAATIIILDYLMMQTFNNKDWGLNLKKEIDEMSKNIDLSILPKNKPQNLEELLGFI